MSMPLFIVNRSTCLTDAQIAAVIPAMQKQVSGDFAPYWVTDAELQFVGVGGAVPDNALQLAVMDNSDQAGALGYHQTNTQGVPVGFVFAKTDLDAGLSWTVTLSHEILEQLADPFIFSTVIHDGSNGGSGGLLGRGGTIIALEVADAPEADQFGYQIDGVLVSDFCTPAWFGLPGSTEYDFKGFCKQPFEVLHGGYIGVRQFRGASDWGQVQGQQNPNAMKWQVLQAKLPDGLPSKMPIEEVPKGSRRWKRLQQTA